LGDKQQALDYYSQALPLAQQAGDHWQESVIRYNIAMIYMSMDELEKAEEQMIRVIALDEALGHPDLESNRKILAQIQAMREGQ
jgi:tetratricopeptide (TPR) repeat protein